MANLRKLLRFFVFLFVLVLLAGAGWFVIVRLRQTGGASAALPGLDDVAVNAYLAARRSQLYVPAGDDPTPITFVVRPGETAASVAQRLQQQGLIKDARLFRAYLRAEGLDAGLEAGEYTLRATMTMAEIARVLQHGRVEERSITIPEGLRLEEVASLVAVKAGLDPNAFLQLARSGDFDYDFLRDRPAGATLEGYLFPDTYRLPEGATAEDLIRRMLDNFDAKVTPAMRAQAAQRGMTLYEVVTLASIVEREAVLPEERPLIASVYLNRLALGMKLDADPTVQYALGYQPEQGTWWPVLTLEDYQGVDSPYNTYKYGGLPPGPIASPGLASIQAVLEPAESDYLYFLRDCEADDGRHLFARTEEEHYANYARCQ